MELQGRIKLITPIQTFGNNGFQKRELIIVTEEQYPQTISFDFTQGNCELLNNYQVGQVVKITFDIRGREWTNPQGEVKYFNSLGQVAPPPQPIQAPQGGTTFAPKAPAPAPQGTDLEEDDLPF